MEHEDFVEMYTLVEHIVTINPYDKAMSYWVGELIEWCTERWPTHGIQFPIIGKAHAREIVNLAMKDDWQSVYEYTEAQEARVREFAASNT